ncbi:MAG TPA: hypothetical protein H9881_02845 [Candidatus Stackebrandtia excrementipullorum]|nr:hypothetical protein [Candidatus Stackebrandtia excrementipullorum]
MNRQIPFTAPERLGLRPYRGAQHRQFPATDDTDAETAPAPAVVEAMDPSPEPDDIPVDPREREADVVVPPDAKAETEPDDDVPPANHDETTPDRWNEPVQAFTSAAGNWVRGNLSQEVNKTFFIGQHPQKRRWKADWRNRESLATEAQTTVPPIQVENLVTVLSRNRFVLLSSPKKSGQRTSARYLVHHMIESEMAGETLRAVTVLLESTELSLTDAVEAHSDAALIVDLTDDEETTENVLGELDVIGENLTKTDSYLILILPDGNIRRNLADRWPVHTLPTPGGHEVFRAKAGTVIPSTVIDELLAEQWLGAELDTARPPTAAWLAHAATDLYLSNTTVPDMVAELKDVGNDWQDRLEKDIGEQADAELRSLTIAASLLPKAPAGVITAAADELQRITGTKEVIPPLCQKSPNRRLEVLNGLGFDVPEREFRRPGYGAAIMPYFWSTFIALQPALRRWWVRLMTHPDPRVFDLDTTVRAVVDVSAKVDTSIAEIAARLVSPPKDVTDSERARGAKAAVALLGAAAVDGTQGRRVRRTLWIWARSNHRDRQLVVARVCALEFGQRYPQNALTRLKHLMDTKDDVVRGAATHALREMAVHVGFVEIANVVTKWSPDTVKSEEVRRVLRELIMEPAAVEYLAAEAKGPRLWGQLLDLLDYDVKPLVDRLLAKAVELPPDRQDVLVTDLVASIDGNQHRYDLLLFSANRSWAESTSDVERLHVRVLSELDRIGPPVLAAARREVSS